MVQETSNRMNAFLRIAGLSLMLFLAMAANAQSKWGATPADSAECVKNLSLYQEFMKQNSYADAYAPYRELIRICPACSKGLYQNGAKLFSEFIAKEKDLVRKERLVDSLLINYDLRIANFGEKGYVLGRKGVDLYFYRPTQCKEANAILHEAIELGGSKSEAGTVSAFYQSLSCMYANGEATKEQMLAEYVRVIGIIEQALGSEGLKEVDREYWTKARDNVNASFYKIAECKEIGGIAEKLINERPGDLDLMERLLKVLGTKDCAEEKVYRRLAEEVCQARPSSECKYSLGMLLVKQGEMVSALKFMKEAVDLCTGCSDRVKYLLKAGQVASAAGNHSQARSYANQVLQVDTKSGEALMLIGNAIAAQAGGCDVPDSWGAYWLAYDYYQRAKSLDPSVSEKAGERMASCNGRFPTKEELFFRSMKEGDDFQVSCGSAGESTKVRAKK
jgi:tetratricopeptide (TPR) repeat protein